MSRAMDDLPDPGKYGRLATDPAGDGIWCVTPTTVRGWSSDALDDGTGWEFRRTGR